MKKEELEVEEAVVHHKLPAYVANMDRLGDSELWVPAGKDGPCCFYMAEGGSRSVISLIIGENFCYDAYFPPFERDSCWLLGAKAHIEVTALVSALHQGILGRQGTDSNAIPWSTAQVEWIVSWLVFSLVAVSALWCS